MSMSYIPIYVLFMFDIFENLTLTTLQYPNIIIIFYFLLCDIYSKNVGKRIKKLISYPRKLMSNAQMAAVFNIL